jgi:prevent-host-death family protein
MSHPEYERYRLDDLPADIRAGVIVNPDSGCWEWQGPYVGGYGVRYRNGDRQRVHRLVYTLLAGPIPIGLTLDHVDDWGCISKACCWPTHLEPVTRGENTRRGQYSAVRRRLAAVPQMIADRGCIKAIGLTEARRDLVDVVDEIEREGAGILLLRWGSPAAVIVPSEQYERVQALVEGIKVMTAEEIRTDPDDREPLTADDISLVETCYACPEQYDAYDPDGRQVGYLRLRHGRFTVDMPDAGGMQVYSAAPEGDGIFDDDKREGYLRTAREKIAEHLNAVRAPEPMALARAVAAALERAAIADWETEPGAGKILEIPADRIAPIVERILKEGGPP